MMINKQGESFEYDGITYRVGDPVIGNEQSEYKGLFGTITEIRDGEDKETENDTPDIYCSFEPPVLPCDRKELEEVFSSLYAEPKTIDDIILDMVHYGAGDDRHARQSHRVPPSSDGICFVGRLGG